MKAIIIPSFIILEHFVSLPYVKVVSVSDHNVKTLFMLYNVTILYLFCYKFKVMLKNYRHLQFASMI